MRFLSLLFIGIALLVPVSSNAQGCMEGGSEEGVNVVGFIQPEFTWKDIGNEDGSEATFAFRRARLGATKGCSIILSSYMRAPSSYGTFPRKRSILCSLSNARRCYSRLPGALPLT